jgi:hypothetical protein
MSQVPFPVIAKHDILQGRSLIEEGTCGEIVGVSGSTPCYYSVIFWPHGADGASVRFDYLTRFDVREA